MASPSRKNNESINFCSLLQQISGFHACFLLETSLHPWDRTPFEGRVWIVTKFCGGESSARAVSRVCSGLALSQSLFTRRSFSSGGFWLELWSRNLFCIGLALWGAGEWRGGHWGIAVGSWCTGDPENVHILRSKCIAVLLCCPVSVHVRVFKMVKFLMNHPL